MRCVHVGACVLCEDMNEATHNQERSLVKKRLAWPVVCSVYIRHFSFNSFGGIFMMSDSTQCG